MREYFPQKYPHHPLQLHCNCDSMNSEGYKFKLNGYIPEFLFNANFINNHKNLFITMDNASHNTRLRAAVAKQTCIVTFSLVFHKLQICVMLD